MTPPSLRRLGSRVRRVGARLRWLAARLDRFPSAWVLVLAGVVLQLAYAGGRLALATASGDEVEVLVAGVLVGVSGLAALAALPAAALLRWGRRPRVAAVCAILLGAGVLALNEFHPATAILPAALFVAAVRVWIGAAFDAAALLRLDPARFERVEPSTRGSSSAVPSSSTPAGRGSDSDEAE